MEGGLPRQNFAKGARQRGAKIRKRSRFFYPLQMDEEDAVLLLSFLRREMERMEMELKRAGGFVLLNRGGCLGVLKFCLVCW